MHWDLSFAAMFGLAAGALAVLALSPETGPALPDFLRTVRFASTQTAPQEQEERPTAAIFLQTELATTIVQGPSLVPSLSLPKTATDLFGDGKQRASRPGEMRSILSTVLGE